MAEIVWTNPALSDLDAIADYIALDNLPAARALVQRGFARVDQLSQFPNGGTAPPELTGRRHRQLVEPPCRIFYRASGKTVLILHVMRGEQRLRRKRLT